MFVRSLRRNLLRRTFRSFSSNTKTLVIAEHNNTELFDSTLSCVTAASLLGSDTTVLVVGSKCQEVADKVANLDGVQKVVVADSEAFEHSIAENVVPMIAKFQKENEFSHILASMTTFGKNVLPRLAGQLNVQPISDVISIKSSDTFERPVYAGNAISTVQSTDDVKILTIRSTSFEKASESTKAPIETYDVADTVSSESTKWISDDLQTSDRPSLTSARIVVSGGRGMKNGENFQMLYDLADNLGHGATVGASRAAVDAGFVGNDLQVGQTGKVVAPDLYVAVGISGAIQHLAGMKDSKVIVAINKDADAPIFQVADYGLVGDLFKVIPELNKELQS
uniref:Electron transfer flavoprotein subunit alpha n=1 Tax=Hirondellea gigas TaxID=1518452 RepID=A0A2P2IBQ4_9CRUS